MIMLKSTHERIVQNLRYQLDLQTRKRVIMESTLKDVNSYIDELKAKVAAMESKNPKRDPVTGRFVKRGE